MNFNLKSISTRLGAAVLMFISTCLVGCGPIVTLYASLDSNNGKNDTEQLKLDSDRFLVDMAKRFGLMALFAEAVYRRDLPEDARDGNGCAYLSAPAKGIEVTRYGMPRSKDGKGNWQRWVPEIAQDNVLPCLDDESGLYYETYVYQDQAGKFLEAVIAFRGTENRSGQIFNDWGTNVAAFLGFEPKQYAVARERVLPLVAALESVLEAHIGGARIYVTGHSLGGGLAQQTGYLTKAVKEVFTFNTSPVTNWSHLRLEGKIGNAYPILHRVYHGGEILEKIRFVSTSVTQARYGRHDIGLQLEGRSSFGGHSMQITACNFANLIATQQDIVMADHHYPLDYIREVLLNDAQPIKPCVRDKDAVGAGTTGASAVR